MDGSTRCRPGVSEQTIWIEAKRIRRSSFQEHQITRNLQALASTATGRSPMLLLVLSAPPPIPVKGLGQVDIHHSIRHSLDRVVDAADHDTVLEAAGSITWITWDEIDGVIRQASQPYTNPDPSTCAAVQRMAADISRTIAWHR